MYRNSWFHWQSDICFVCVFLAVYIHASLQGILEHVAYSLGTRLVCEGCGGGSRTKTSVFLAHSSDPVYSLKPISHNTDATYVHWVGQMCYMHHVQTSTWWDGIVTCFWGLGERYQFKARQSICTENHWNKAESQKITWASILVTMHPSNPVMPWESGCKVCAEMAGCIIAFRTHGLRVIRFWERETSPRLHHIMVSPD